MDRWTRLRKWITQEKHYYRLNRHAQEWLPHVLAEMSRLEAEDGVKTELCTTVVYDREIGRSRVCGLPRFHWKEKRE